MITTLTGQNYYLIKATQKELEAKFKKSTDNGSIEKLDALDMDFSALVEWLCATSLFSPDRMLIITSLSKNSSLAERIEEILDSVGDGVDLLLVESGLDMRTKLAKILQKKTDFKKFDILKSYGIAPWLVDEAKKRGGILNIKDAELLVSRVGENQGILSSELDKLINYDDHITGESIEILTEQQPLSKIFELLNAAFSKRKGDVIKLFEEQRVQQIDPQQILSMIAWQLHVFLLLKHAESKNRDRIIRDAGISPYVVQNSEPLVRKISRGDLIDYTEKVIQLEVESKSRALSINEAVLTLMLEIAS